MDGEDGLEQPQDVQSDEVPSVGSLLVPTPEPTPEPEQDATGDHFPGVAK